MKDPLSTEIGVERFAPPDRLGFVRCWVTVWRDPKNGHAEVAIAAPTLPQLVRRFREITGVACVKKCCTRAIFRKSKS